MAPLKVSKILCSKFHRPQHRSRPYILSSRRGIRWYVYGKDRFPENAENLNAI